MKNLITMIAALGFSTLIGCGGPSLGEACDQLGEACSGSDLLEENGVGEWEDCVDLYGGGVGYDAKEFQSCAKDADTCRSDSCLFSRCRCGHG